jgi:hypothetical protein
MSGSSPDIWPAGGTRMTRSERSYCDGTDGCTCMLAAYCRMARLPARSSKMPGSRSFADCPGSTDRSEDAVRRAIAGLGPLHRAVLSTVS